MPRSTQPLVCAAPAVAIDVGGELDELQAVVVGLRL